MLRSPPEPESEEISLYISTYYSLLRSSGEVRVRAFEEGHAYSGSSLHTGALDDEPDLSAFAYAAARLPDDMPDVIRDDTALTPLSSYGVQKAMGELLVNDYSRKGFVDGRALRLPTITVRPGKPNAAASSFASGIIREPLNGIESMVPVGPDTRMWILSPRTVIDNLMIGHDVDASAFGRFRSVSVPGMQMRVGDMADALRRVAGPEVASRIQWKLDPRIDRIVSTWPSNFDCEKGRSLGMKADDNFDDIVRAHIADERPKAVAA